MTLSDRPTTTTNVNGIRNVVDQSDGIFGKDGIATPTTLVFAGASASLTWATSREAVAPRCDRRIFLHLLAHIPSDFLKPLPDSSFNRSDFYGVLREDTPDANWQLNGIPSLSEEEYLG